MKINLTVENKERKKMKIVFTPDWFLGSDVCIEIFSFAILLLFFILSYRSYRMSKNKNSLYLGIGFLLIAVAELSTTITKLVLYYDVLFAQQIGQVVVTYKFLKSVDIFYYIGFFLHKLFTLAGLYVIYRIPLKKKYSNDIILALCFIIISALFGTTFYYLFHFTALLLLVFIIKNYYDIYKKNKLYNTQILIIAFSMLALSQILFILSGVGFLYVVGQIVQLVSYLILLFLIIRIIKTQYGRQKEKQNRHNIGYAGYNKRKRRKD